jgi:hypothetical protein
LRRAQGILLPSNSSQATPSFSAQAHQTAVLHLLEKHPFCRKHATSKRYKANRRDKARNYLYIMLDLLANPVGLINCRRGQFSGLALQARSSCNKKPAYLWKTLANDHHPRKRKRTV